MIFNGEKIKRLERRIHQLESSSVQVCPECGYAQSRKNFIERTGMGSYDRKYCDSCKNAVEKRDKAVRIAQHNPDKVINCMEKTKK